MADLFDEMAQRVLDDIGDAVISPISLASISLWFRNNLPALNIKLFSCFTEETLALCPAAQEIFIQMYLVKYASANVNWALSGAINISSGGSDILSLKDGTSSVTFANKNEIAKTLNLLLNTAKDVLDDLISAYLAKKTKPGQIVAIPPVDGLR